MVSTAAINRRRRLRDPRFRVEAQRASNRREAQGSGRESLQRFWTLGPVYGKGREQERQRSVHDVVGSTYPQKIDLSWHVPPVKTMRNETESVHPGYVCRRQEIDRGNLDNDPAPFSMCRSNRCVWSAKDLAIRLGWPSHVTCWLPTMFCQSGWER